MSSVKNIKLNNGLEIPSFGLGTWQGEPGKEEEVYHAVKDAIDLGYRLFDCANFYSNEASIGHAIAEKIAEEVIRREDIYIVSKLWCNSHSPNAVEAAIQKTLKDFQMDFIDLYLIHWPQAFKEGGEMIPKDPNTENVLMGSVDLTVTWKAMEDICKQGLTKSIGVSNFNSIQIQKILDSCIIPPQVNQCFKIINSLTEPVSVKAGERHLPCFKEFCDEIKYMYLSDEIK